jgi:hypothetical protein
VLLGQAGQECNARLTDGIWTLSFPARGADRPGVAEPAAAERDFAAILRAAEEAFEAVTRQVVAQSTFILEAVGQDFVQLSEANGTRRLVPLARVDVVIRPRVRTPLTAIEEGSKIYSLICVSCHDPDPTVDRVGGTFGPPIAGSSLELLELNVLRNEYPEGYTPKRDTSLMTPFPLTGTQIRSLHAFLNAK